MGIGPTGYVIAGLLSLATLSPGTASANCAYDRVTFRPAGAAQVPEIATFSAEIADDARSRARGLMARTSMPLDHGMLFIFPKVAPVAFWMKNTPLPLDIIFLDPTGRVCSIAAETTPFSLDLLPSGCAVQTVFEVNAGQAAELGISVGSIARHPAILNPAWPCE